MGPVSTMASTPVATTTVAPTPTTGTVVLHGGPSLQHPFTDGIFYRGVGVRQIQDKGEKSQQIEQLTDIVTEPARKMLTRQESAVVRLKAAVRSLLARRRVREMRDLQLIQPCTPSQLLQVALRRAEDLDLVHYVGDLGHVVAPRGVGMRFSTQAANSKFSAAVGEALPSLSFSIDSPPHSSLRCRPAAVRRGEGMGSPAGAHCLALPHSATGHREGVFAVRCGNHFRVATLMQSFHPDGVHGIQVAVHVQV
jgi:hypothetical protein